MNRRDFIKGMAAAALLLPTFHAFAKKPGDKKLVCTDLLNAYNGEMNANRKYLSYADDAERKGYRSLATLYRAIALSELTHAGMQAAVLRELGAEVRFVPVRIKVGDIKANLNDAIRVETREFTEMYISYMRRADKAGFPGAVEVYRRANKAEVEHALLFNEVVKNPDAWKSPGRTFVICGNCGYTSQGRLTGEPCPQCGAPESKAKFFK